MAQASVDIAMEKTSQEILEMCKIIRTMVTDVEKFDWKNFWANFIITKAQRIQLEKS